MELEWAEELDQVELAGRWAGPVDKSAALAGRTQAQVETLAGLGNTSAAGTDRSKSGCSFHSCRLGTAGTSVLPGRRRGLAGLVELAAWAGTIGWVELAGLVELVGLIGSVELVHWLARQECRAGLKPNHRTPNSLPSTNGLPKHFKNR